ncbi:ZFYVE26 isoform 7 [Pan troglodytes]|uniref:ZFYVE26 isoform 7 n=1 Tax=Pan troglodytes TaxID=9598 RepID=A0A2J8PIT5_PANTR|nr:ZFYVE26 isoform 7 [Pan troglodytes]
MNHPFGKEEAASQKQLFGFFCECLRRGEWELAQACVPQLQEGQGDIPKRVEDILQALVVCPNLLRCGQDINPQRVAWVWLLVLEKWLAREKKLLPVVFRRKLEFLLLSEDLQGDIPENILEELYETLTQGAVGHVPDGNPRRESWTPRLSSEAVSVLWDLLRQSPQPAQALLELLLEEDDGTGLSHWPLQNALVDLIRKALRALQGPDSVPPGVVDAIYGALRTLRCPAEPLGVELRLLCEELLEACRTKGSPLREERLLSCLLHKASRGLLSLYGHTYAEKVTEKPPRATASGKVSPDHLDPERAMLALFSNPNPAEAWKVAYFYCLSNNKHFLEQILVTALTLLKEEDFPNLGCLLDREFRPLSCLLVLLGWTHCQSLESAKRLLQTLHRTQGPGCDELLRDACDGLWAHLEVLEWCIQQSSNPIPKRDLLYHLHGGDSHSVLYTLHHLTNLPALKEEDVLKLLQKVPAKDPQQEPDAVDAPVPEHLSQCQNLTLYQGFCAMKYAIYALCVNSHQHSQCQDCKDSLSEDLASATEPANDSLSSPGAANLFSTYLARCQQYLCSIPDSLCLELLENIFSLLLITSADLHPEPHLPEDYAEDDDIEGKSPSGLRSPSESPQHIAHPERKSERGSLGVPKTLAYTMPSHVKAEPKDSYPGPHRHSFLDLKHFTSGISGFLADEFAIGAFLRLLQEQLDEISSRSPPEKPKQESQSCSGSRDGLQSRLHRLSKVVSEAQWRHKVVTSNHRSEEQPSRRYQPATRHPSLRRGRRTRRSQADGRDRGSNPSLESTSSELSTSTSEGSLSAMSGRNELHSRLHPHPQSSLIPMMFSPPESLLASCILRGNFAEAHQVLFTFNLKSSPSSGELMFMERYQEVIQELAQVEHKIENQNSDAGSSTIRRTGSGRSTLQAIGSAAAAGMVFYSISDVTDKLLNTSGDPIPMLQEDFWISTALVEPTAPLREVLEDLSPPAMAAFDLACSQCQLWKTCKQLLETAERRLNSSLERRGRRIDHVLLNADGIRGFPVVLQQISKSLNYLLMSASQTKSESVEEKGGGPPRCSITELLQMCWPSLTEDCVASHTTLSQQLDQVLQSLREALELPEPRTPPLSSLVEQAAQKAPEAEAHPVQIQTQLLQKNLGKQTPSGSRQMDYLGTFFSYCSTLAAVLLQSLSSEPDHVEVKVGNPFVLLQQSSSQLVSHLLFERQVPPERLAALLAQENLSLSVPQVIVSCCCEPLALCSSRQSQQTSSLLTRLGTLAQLHASHCLDDLPLSTPSSPRTTENPTLERKPYSSPRDSSLPALTSSALAFLKSRSKLLATVACLGASPRLKVSKPSLSWKELRGRREVPLAAEQVARECERLLEQFPLFEAFLLAAWEPLRGSLQQGQSLAVNLCGWASLSTVLLGLHSPIALDVLSEAFEESLVARDWSRALQLTEVYGRDVDDLSSIKDAVLSCAVACDKEGWQYLFPVKDASLRSRLALQFVDRWPLESCLEILAYCISDTAVQEGLKCELQRKLAELQVYQKILGLQSPPVWCDWQTLRSCCVEDPSTVMNMILEAQLLRRIPDPTMCLEVTEQSLDQHTSLATSHFLANYLTTHFYGQLTAVRHREIQALYVGSKILLTLPEQHRASYSHLSSNPLFMLEQLLMNMKVDWATVAVQTLQQLLVGQEIGFTMDEVDSLLSRYAEKALDFPYPQREKRSALDSSKSESPPYSFVVRVPKADEVEWILDLKEEENELVRSEFYYEQAPSASLCIAILNLHRDSIACGHQLIEHCCRLSKGLTNPEVDAGLLTDIMKQLLFSAKMMFVKAGQSQDLALCDSYISKVDVLNILVAAAYRHVPSLDQILQPAAVTRLRNQLLEAEYYQLGVEQDDDYFATLRELEATLRTQSLSLAVIPEGKIMNNTYYQECLFYLHNYSTNLAIISFYVRHSCLREALLHLLNKESPPEVFIEGIFQPSYKSGKLHTLENLLESIDPTLESWGKYLIAACQHLQKKNYYHILYELQQFMKDQVRAAMTCIRFFSHKAKSYTELGEKLSWLLKAKDHLKIYLQETSRSSGRKKTTFFRKKMTAADVSRHMNTLQLQMEVTRFLHRCESAGTSQITTLPLPTLFGNNHVKMDVACKVMLGGKNVEDGFGIAFRVLQDFQLDAAMTYCRAARQLVEKEKYSEIQQLLKCVSESGMAAKSDEDTILLNCLEAFKRIPPQELEGLIQAIHNDDNKLCILDLSVMDAFPLSLITDCQVRAYLICCKLRSAYLIAVKQEHSRATALVQQVQQAAKSSGDAVVQDICAQWLLTSHPRGAHGSGSRK